MSYWIIAKFDNFTTQFTEINNAMSALQSMIETNTDNIATNDAEIAEIKNTLTSINSDIETLQTDYNTLNTDLTTLYGQHQQLSNKVASMEDAVLDLPGIKQDITGLQSNVSANTKNITELQSNVASNTEMVNVLMSVAPAIIDLTQSKYRNHPHIIINMPLSSSSPRAIIRVPDILNWEYQGNVVFDIFYQNIDNVTFSTIDASSPYVSEDIYNLLPNNPMNNSINTYTKMELAGMTGNPYGLALRVIAYKSNSDGVQYTWCLL